MRDKSGWVHVEVVIGVCDLVIAVVERQKQIETQEEVLRESSKETDVSSIVQLKKMYEDENIREIKETEEQSELAPVPPATKEGSLDVVLVVLCLDCETDWMGRVRCRCFELL